MLVVIVMFQSHLAQDRATLVRAAFAENIAQLAKSALRVLEMIQLSDTEDLDEKDDTTQFVSILSVK